MKKQKKVNIQKLIDIIERNTDFRVTEKIGGEITLKLYDTEIKIIKDYYYVPCVNLCREDVEHEFSKEECKDFNFSNENIREMAEKVGEGLVQYGHYGHLIRLNKDLMLRSDK